MEDFIVKEASLLMKDRYTNVEEKDSCGKRKKK